jgi:class 3 adenylate cyclase
MRLGDISFRAKLLIALVGTVGLLGAASMAVVRFETERQLDWIVQRTAIRSQEAMAELERFRRSDLERLALRLTGSIRIAAALDAAVEDGHADEFVEHVLYELTLAELERGLVAFTDETGHPVVTLVHGARVPTETFVGRHMEDRDEPLAEYRLVKGELFATQSHRLDLFGQPVGTLTLGFPLDDHVATRLGEIVGVEVCFAATARCMAGTPGVREGRLAARMLESVGLDQPVYITWQDTRLALVSRPLPATDGIASIIAVPLEEVLTPFDRIQRAERIAAAVVLVLAIGFALVLSKGLTTPIRTLVAATERVRRGDYDFRVKVPYRDEVGTLADAFNQMTEGLLLKERYRGVLDQVVSRHVAEELLRGEIVLGGETRELTTLFADIRGFTSLTEHMEPQAVIGMLNEWLELAAECIEQERGVVDKYVGDQVMAIFGAPIMQEDHPERAVRAALRLRDRTAELSQRREARGDPPLAIGIGVNTGPAVAGNTGSSRRLNYTVLGASVNAAARLCSQAGPGQVLISEETGRRTKEVVDATPLPPRVIKGFSHPITPYEVHGLREGPRPRQAVARSSAITVLILVAGWLLAGTSRSAAQPVDLPTLQELGVHYISPEGFLQIQPSLRIDLDGYIPQDDPAWHIAEVDPFVAGRARFFLDVFLGRHLFGAVELRLDRGQPPRAGGLEGHVQQSFVRLSPSPGTNLHLQVGKFITPFGNYPQRAHTPAANPFIRPPLLYDYRTVMQADFAPLANDGVLGWKDNPEFRPEGLPIVWDVPYPIGVMATGGAGGFAFRGGIVNSAPSADPSDWNRLRFAAPAGPSYIGHASYQIVPELQVGASYSRGSFLRRGVEDGFGPIEVGRHLQEARAVEATFRRGHLDVRSELVVNRWEVPRVIDDPTDLSYYVEARMTLAPGLFGAIRYNAIHVLEIARLAGGTERWDYDVRRWQFGAGYRLGRSTEVRGEYLINRTLERPDPRDNLFTLQWWWMF